MIDSNDPRLTAYLLGELDDAEKKTVENALANSPELRQEVAGIRESIDLLASGLQSEPCPELTETQREKIGEASAAALSSPAEAATTKPPVGTSRRRRFALAVAVSLLIVACGIATLVIPSVAKTLFPSRDNVAHSGASQTATGEGDRSGERPLRLDEPSSDEEEVRRQLAEENPVGAIESQRLKESPFDDRSPVPFGDVRRWSELSRDRARLSSPSETASPQDPFGSSSGDMGSSGKEPGMMGMGMPAAAAEGEMSGGGYPGLPQDDLDLGWTEDEPAAPSSWRPPQFGGYGGAMGGYGRPEGDGRGMSDALGAQPDRGGMMGAAPGGGVARRPAQDGMQPNFHGADMAGDASGRGGERASGEAPAPISNLTHGMDFDGMRLKPPAEPPSRLDGALKDFRELGEVESWNALNQPRDRSQPAESAGSPESPVPESLDYGEDDYAKAAETEDESLVEELSEAKRPRVRPNKPTRVTWKRAKATPNASRLMIGDHDELPLEGMQANVLVDGFRARVLLDCYYFNDRNQQLEGNFKLRLPNDASLYYFAFGESAYEYRPAVDQLAAKGFLSADLVRAAGLDPKGILRAREGSWSKVKRARVVPREKAAHAYGETVRRRVDPALVEWSGAGVFQTRVFPLMPNKLHRVVIGYDVTLQQDGQDLVYRLDLPEDLSQCMVDLDVAALPGMTAEVTPDARPFTSGGRAYYHFGETGDQQVSVRLRSKGTILLAGSDDETGDFFATRFTPPLPAGEEKASSSHAVFLVDTSLSSRPEKFNVWLDMLDAVLTKNSDSLRHFAILFFDIESHWWRSEFTPNTPENVQALLTHCHSLALEGATDLEQALAEATHPEWWDADKKQPDTDLFLLSDGAITWGDMNQHRLSQILQSRSGGSLFAYKTGLTGTATAVLDHLARETGGAVFSMANPEETQAAAIAHRRRPWKLLEVTMPGGSDLLVAGRPQFVYPGQTLTVVGRGQPAAKTTLRLRRGGENKTVEVSLNQVVKSDLAPRAYGEIAVGQLEDLGSDLEDVSVAYARHFRVTGKTCSLLMLESEQDYQRFNIKPEDDAFVIQSSPSAELIARKLDELAERLSDAKVAFLAWLEKLEKTPGLQFEVPTALRLVIERLPRETFEVDRPRLACQQRKRGGSPKKYLQQLDHQQLDYEVVNAEALRRLEEHGSADALKALSSLVESNPGDPVLTRDVAFSAMQWGLEDQAYPLLKRLTLIRPYEPQTYQALGQCLSEMGNADLAMIYYEIALHGRWHDRYQDVNQIVSVEYLHLLRKIQREKPSVQAPEYARGRLQTLADGLPSDKADLVVTMMWNTDRTDVDLHVVEPSGEECYYDHPRTRSGGRVTRDVTEGYGPEMYVLPKAPKGTYRILANYFGSDANRTQVRTKVYITTYKDFGGKRERIDKQTVTLSESKEKRELAKIVVKK